MNDEIRVKYSMELMQHQAILYKLCYFLMEINAMLIDLL